MCHCFLLFFRKYYFHELFFVKCYPEIDALTTVLKPPKQGKILPNYKKA